MQVTKTHILNWITESARVKLAHKDVPLPLLWQLYHSAWTASDKKPGQEHLLFASESVKECWRRSRHAPNCAAVTDYPHANAVINLQAQCPRVHRRYYAFVSRKISGESHTRAHRHPHPPHARSHACATDTCCLWWVILTQREEKGRRGERGGRGWGGRELPRLLGGEAANDERGDRGDRAMERMSWEVLRQRLLAGWVFVGGLGGS